MTNGPVVGFVGLGNMGAPMAANIAAAGFELIGHDVAGTVGRLPAGATAAASVEELAARADTLLLSVPDATAVRTVVDDIADATGRRTSVVIDLSTVGPFAAREAAARLAALGIEYADGPVSGGVAGARAATISLMFAGSDAVFGSHRPLLESFAGRVFHVGRQPGQGQAMKLLNNFLSATALAASSEAFAVGIAHGLDLETMLEVVNASTGRNTATADKFPNRVLTGTYDAGFRTGLMAKDVRLFASIAERAGTRHDVASAIDTVWEACDRALPGSDFSEIWRFVRGPD